MQVTQNQLEHVMHKQHVSRAIAKEIEEFMQPNIEAAVLTLKLYLDKVQWETAEIRKNAIRNECPTSIVMKVLTAIVGTCQKEMPFISVGSMIHLSDELDTLANIQLACDLVSILTSSGMYTINTASTGSRSVQSLCTPSESVLRLMRLKCAMPPMLCRPEVLETNTDSGYLTVKKDSVFLGGRLNDHNGTVSLDVLNTLNGNEYELDKETVSEAKPWDREILSPEQVAALSHEEQMDYYNALTTRVNYLEQFQYLIKVFDDRSLHFQHKADKRGRIYSQGYHLNPAGSGYEKACVNFKKKEFITGEL